MLDASFDCAFIREAAFFGAAVCPRSGTTLLPTINSPEPIPDTATRKTAIVSDELGRVIYPFVVPV